MAGLQDSRWAAQILQAAAAAGVKPDLLYRLVVAESREDEKAISPAGARGLTQLMPGTAKDLGVNPDDPDQNLAGGARYLKQQLDRHNGDERLALMSYNWGPGNVDKWQRGGANPSLIPQETQGYLGKILGGAGLTPMPAPVNIPGGGVFDPGVATGAPDAQQEAYGPPEPYGPPASAAPAKGAGKDYWAAIGKAGGSLMKYGAEPDQQPVGLLSHQFHRPAPAAMNFLQSIFG